MSRPLRAAASASVLGSLVLAAAVPSTAAAAGPSKDQCVDAHSRGQDAVEAGQLSMARKLFLVCAQSTCPPLIQGDCARFSEELERRQPSVSFGARDAAQRDLPDTAVYVDGALVAVRLDNGKSHDLDPGRHVVRFVNGSREVTMTVVLGEGEKGRSVVAIMTSSPDPREGGSERAPTPPPVVEPMRPLAPLVVAGGGGVALVTGVILTVVGLSSVPSSCSLSPRECAAAPGDPVFSSAKSGVALANLGVVTGVAGMVAASTGLVWYFLSARVPPPRREVLAPWLGDHAAGIALTGTL